MVTVETEPDPATGQRRQVSAGTYRTKREAEQRKAEVVAAGLERPSDLTLRTFLVEEWLPSKAEKAAPTRQQYRWAVTGLVEALGEARLSGLTARQVQAFYAELRARGLSSRSRQVIGKVLRMALADAVKRGYVARNVAAAVELPSGARQGEIRVWSRAEAAAFLEATAGDRLFPAWALALGTGLRRGELCALRWVDVDLGACRLAVRQAVGLDGYEASIGRPKTRSSIRTIGIDQETVGMLGQWRARQAVEGEFVGRRPELVITQPDGSMIHPQTLALAFKRAVEAAKLGDIGLHGLRHTHATMLLEAGVPLKVVSERLGHSSIAITADTYQHVLDHMQDKAAEAMRGLLPQFARAESGAASASGASVDVERVDT
jgi:integrase